MSSDVGERSVRGAATETSEKNGTANDGAVNGQSGNGAAETGQAPHEPINNGDQPPAAVPPTPDLGDRVNALVRAILEQLVPESKRVAGSLSGLEERFSETQNKVNELQTFAHRWTDKILADAQQRATRAMDAVLSQVIYPLHDQLFTKICAMEAGQEEPDPYLLNLLQNLEGYLDRLDVLVIRPQPGEMFDLKHMETLGAVPCRFFRRPDTVARVHHCGFALRHGAKDDRTVARKALVDVYRKL